MNQIDIHFRWMIRRDMPEVLRIEEDWFQFQAWREEDFLFWLRKRNCIGMVAESLADPSPVLGFVIYEFTRKDIRLVNFAVAPSHWRHGIGRQMISRMKGKLDERRSRLALAVRETNLDAQFFLWSQGFRAWGSQRGYYKDTGEDAIFMHLLRPNSTSSNAGADLDQMPAMEAHEHDIGGEAGGA